MGIRDGCAVFNVRCGRWRDIKGFKKSIFLVSFRDFFLTGFNFYISSILISDVRESNETVGSAARCSDDYDEQSSRVQPHIIIFRRKYTIIEGLTDRTCHF